MAEELPLAPLLFELEGYIFNGLMIMIPNPRPRNYFETDFL
jgi:hypothetical protein